MEQYRQKMIKLFYKTKLKSAEKESILINLFSKWILLIYRKIWVFAVFLIKLYSKATFAFVYINFESYFGIIGLCLIFIGFLTGVISFLIKKN